MRGATLDSSSSSQHAAALAGCVECNNAGSTTRRRRYGATAPLALRYASGCIILGDTHAITVRQLMQHVKLIS